MQKLMEDLSILHNCKDRTPHYSQVPLQVSRGGNWVWLGLDQQTLFSDAICQKEGKVCFKSYVEKCLKKVTIEHAADLFPLDSSESLKGHGLSYHEIEQYVDKKMKVHHCTANQENACISKIWWE